MKILAIDTSTGACSAAVLAADRVFERFEFAPQRHAELILPMIESVLSDAGLKLHDIDGLAFGRGPGAFTGVRIAVGVIQGISLGTGLKVAPVSTLAALAQGVYRQHEAARVLTAIDARMGEIYFAAFAVEPVQDQNESFPRRRESTGKSTTEFWRLQEVLAERVCKTAEAPLPESAGWIGAGTGFATYPEPLRERLGSLLGDVLPDAHPHAQDVATLAVDIFARGDAVDAEYALPVYLRDRVADTQ